VKTKVAVCSAKFQWHCEFVNLRCVAFAKISMVHYDYANFTVNPNIN